MNELKKDIYLPEPVFRNILDFCGNPLPANRVDGVGFNKRYYREFYRYKGNICSRRVQRTIRCKKCDGLYLDTGYDFCGDCYEEKCDTCGGAKSNPMKSVCIKCERKTFKYKCSECEKPLKKNYPLCYDCNKDKNSEVDCFGRRKCAPKEIKKAHRKNCRDCGVRMKGDQPFMTRCVKCFKKETSIFGKGKCYIKL